MKFINYIKEITKNKEPQKNIYGKPIVNYFYIEDLKFEGEIETNRLKDINFFYDDKSDSLDVDFILTYKNYTLATDVSLQFFHPFQFDFIGNAEKTTHIDTALKQLKGVYNTIFKFEISNNHLTIQAKNETLDFQLKTQFKKLNLDIEFINTTSFIDTLVKREKHTKIFNTLCEIITDKQLMVIAEADYGYEAEEAFAVLKQIQQTQRLPKEIPYIVKEVLSLTRYGRKLNTIEEQQTKIFNNVIILLGKYNEKYDLIGEAEEISAGIFIEATKVGEFFIKQTQAFFLEMLSTNTYGKEVKIYTYLIAGCDLILKNEVDFKNGFQFLQQIGFVKELDFEDDISFTAKSVERATEIMLQNIHFIQDKELQKEAEQLFTNVIRICKERYDINAINELFARTFTKEEEKAYLKLIPELIKVEYNDRYKFLAQKGLTEEQNKILRRSLSNASHFLDGSDYDMELKKNVFFDEYVKIMKKHR